MSQAPVHPGMSEADAARWKESLELVVSVTASSGGAFWFRHADNTLKLACQYGLGEERLDQVQQNWTGHAEALAEAARSQQPRAFHAQFQQQNQSSQDLRVTLIPTKQAGSLQGIFELFFPATNDVSLAQLEETIQRLTRWSQFSNSHNTSQARDLAIWLSQIHSQVGLLETSTVLANETRVWSGWDRVAVAIREGSRFRIQSISGQEAFDPRAGAVRELESLIQQLSTSSKESDTHDSPQGESLPQNSLVLLHRPSDSGTPEPIGAMLFQNFDRQPEARSAEELQSLATDAANTLNRALLYQQARSSYSTRIWRTLRSNASLRRIATLASTALLLIGLCCIPADLVISGTGILEPEKQQDVFAQNQGIIEELMVQHGEHVEQNSLLARLRSPEMEYERDRLQGERLTVIQQIRDLETLQADSRRSGERLQSQNELAAKAEELKTVQASLEQQLKILTARMDQLVLRSPMSGEVLTWNLSQTLSNRPVNRTDRLMTIAQLDGPWQLQIKVDHRDLQPVLNSIADQSAQVTFVTADAPGHAYQATIREAGTVIDHDSISGATLTVIATIDRDRIPHVRPGTAVISHIDCGKRSVGSVWFRRLIDRVTSWWTLRSPLTSSAAGPTTGAQSSGSSSSH